MRQDQFTVRAQEVIANAQSLAEGADHADVILLTHRTREREIDAAMAAGATAVNGLQFGSSQIGKARYDALALAVVDAKTRAEAMARALGLKLGRVVWLSDSSSYSPPMPMMRTMAAPMMESAAPTPIEAGQLDVSASVNFAACLVP
mgnify:CR=1 FL=1